MIGAVGIDIGGTKIEAQLFDAAWTIKDRKRVETPREYKALVRAVADLIAWAEASGAQGLPMGIGAAGLVNPATGLALTANLCATGHPFPADIAAAAGRPVAYFNDCRTLALSEAVFGAGRGKRVVVGLIIGTGIGGGIAIDGALVPGPAMVGGEFGHMSAPAHLVAAHGLPVVACGCGRMGCTETLIAGPGLARIAQTLTGTASTAPQIATSRRTDPRAARVWGVWCDLVADLLMTLTLTVDPDCIVLGGGLSKAEGLVPDLTAALRRAQLAGFAVPELLLAEGGDTSGARGAAYAAWQEAHHV
jgi:predicted NBD/HSP70 family sugar kinase